MVDEMRLKKRYNEISVLDAEMLTLQNRVIALDEAMQTVLARIATIGGTRQKMLDQIVEVVAQETGLKPIVKDLVVDSKG